MKKSLTPTRHETNADLAGLNLGEFLGSAETFDRGWNNRRVRRMTQEEVNADWNGFLGGALKDEIDRLNPTMIIVIDAVGEVSFPHPQRLRLVEYYVAS
ncbi:MAG: hypothetical protein HY507_02390 [Candidatus Zambryskibacteria bacterium]|nr:hypothetical protein [Candidatus Zambryskibacteria bacterium]